MVELLGALVVALWRFAGLGVSLHLAYVAPSSKARINEDFRFLSIIHFDHTLIPWAD